MSGAGAGAEGRTAPGALAGERVVVTRPEDRRGPLARALAAQGAEVLLWPAVRFAPPADPAPLRRALADLGRWEWIVLTSPRAVAAVAAAGPPPAGCRVAAVGCATARALAEAGWTADLVPATSTGEGLAAALVAAGVAGRRVLLPVSSRARETVEEALAVAGARVHRVVAYCTVPAALDADVCLAALAAGPPPILTFASPSAVAGLVAGVTTALGEAATGRLRARCPAAVIGPTTGRAAEEAGFTVAATASHTTLEGLAAAVESIAQRRREP